MLNKYPKVPHTAPNTLMFISVKGEFVLFGDDILVPARRETNEMIDVYVVGPCPHLGNNEFTIPVDAYEHPTIH